MIKSNCSRFAKLLRADLKGFEKVISDKTFRAHFSEIQGEKSKRIDKSLQAAAEKQPLIYNKSFYWFKKLEPELVTADDLVDVFMEHYQIMAPANQYFRKALGA